MMELITRKGREVGGSVHTILTHAALRTMLVWAAIAASCSLALAMQTVLTLAFSRKRWRWIAALASVGVNLGALVLVAGFALFVVTLSAKQARPAEH